MNDLTLFIVVYLAVIVVSLLLGWVIHHLTQAYYRWVGEDRG